MPGEAGPEDSRTLARMLLDLGINVPDHPALSDRESLGKYLVGLKPPSGSGSERTLAQWRHERRQVSQAGVERAREALAAWKPETGQSNAPHKGHAPGAGDSVPGTAKTGPNEGRLQPQVPPDSAAGQDVHDSADEGVPPEEVLKRVRATAPPEHAELIGQMEDLSGEDRFVEAFRLGVDRFEQNCEESVVDACVCVSRLASRWDREKRVAPYSLFDLFDGLAAGFGKHVREMRHIDPDPLRATSGLYRLAGKIYVAWVDHCAAILEHQHKRTNTQWVQLDWVQPHRFNCLLSVMRSAVRIKLPLDLLLRVYQKLRGVIYIGKSAIALDARRVKFEGDCLRVLASPSKDLIPDLCYIIYRDIIDTYVEAGENAAAMMFCDQALLIRRGDHEVEHIKAEIIAKSGHKGGVALRPGQHPRAPHF